MNIILAEHWWLMPVILGMYSGGRDQEALHSKPASENSLRDPILKKHNHKKRTGGIAQSAGAEFKIQHCQCLNV
jgi:hypothetical protein